MYHRQQNKWYHKGARLSEKLQLAAAFCNEFDCSNKFDSCYCGQVNRNGQVKLRNGQVNSFGGTIYFAGDGPKSYHFCCIAPT